MTYSLNIVNKCMLCFRDTLNTRKRSVGVALVGFVWLLIILLITKLGSVYIVNAKPDLGEMISLINGFAPLIGLLLIPFILSFLYTLLLCSVERILERGDNNAVPERSGKDKWRIVRNYLIFTSTTYISLKEHSPPYLFCL